MEADRLSVASLNEVRAVFETSVFRVIAVTQAMLPLLREAPAARIANVSSSVGSLTLNPDPKNPYHSMFGAHSASKTALNAVTLAFALELESTRIMVNAACPGFTATPLTNFQGTRPRERRSASRFSTRMVRRVRRRNGRLRRSSKTDRQPSCDRGGSDPKATVDAILKLVDAEDPPLRLALGSGVLHNPDCRSYEDCRQGQFRRRERFVQRGSTND